MNIDKISAGKDVPNELNAIIEIPMGGDPIKYELDKESGAIFVDRLLHTPMFYPCNYGFVPNTLSGDGDPLDVLIISKYRLMPGCVVPCRPIGCLMTEDESGKDEKIIAVPSRKVHSFYDNIEDISDMPKITIDEIKHFFEHYKDLEPNKWVKVYDVVGVEESKKIILESVDRFQGKIS